MYNQFDCCKRHSPIKPGLSGIGLLDWQRVRGIPWQHSTKAIANESLGRGTLKRITFFLLVATILVPGTTLAQTRGRKSTPARSTTTSLSDKRTIGAKRVADQIKTLTRFIFVLGGVAKGLEGVDDAARRNEASPAVLEQAKQNKLTVRTSIRKVREGLDQLESDFSSTIELRRYYTKLAGVAAGAAAAEEQAAANQFDKAGRSLLDVVNRLTDVLLEMR